MHGVVVEVRIAPDREEEARSMLRETIVPRARAHRGLSAGYWFRALHGDVLRAVQVFDTEANARATADRIRSEGPPPGAPVTLTSVEVYEVIAQV
jgi:hypothetical protein